MGVWSTLLVGAHPSVAPSLASFQYQKERPPAPSCCPEHPRQPLNVYCVQDRQPVCGLCLTVGRHQGHAIDDLHAAFLRERQTLGQLLAALSEQRLAQVGPALFVSSDSLIIHNSLNL